VEVLVVAADLRRVALEVIVVADAPLLAAVLRARAALLALLAGLTLALALALARLPRLALPRLLAARARDEVLVLAVLVERILRALIALLLGAAHGLAEVVHLRRH